MGLGHGGCGIIRKGRKVLSNHGGAKGEEDLMALVPKRRDGAPPEGGTMGPSGLREALNLLLPASSHVMGRQ